VQDIERNIMAALQKVTDPATGMDIVTSGFISGLQVRDGHALFALEVDPAQGPALEPLRQQAEAAAASVNGIRQVTAVLTAKKTAEAPDLNSHGKRKAKIENLAPSIKKIIAVASGKGGVGKSTVAVNLAVALAASGAKTGLMDADIYGPSVPRMLGLSGKPDVIDGKLQPHEAFGIKAVSMGSLVDQEAAMIWRGPMIQSALRQFLADVNWGDLDILVVDMPPGTGDAQLTMAQKVPLAGAVIVSTPQDIALLDARRAIQMFRQVNVPILGVIENMSVFTCPNCGHEEHIFGHGGAKADAERFGVPFLGELSLRLAVRESGDAGRPLAAKAGDELAARFGAMAERIRNSLLHSL
jgi:ATP-binding protein involved in chromosome partitioning